MVTSADANNGQQTKLTVGGVLVGPLLVREIAPFKVMGKS